MKTFVASLLLMIVCSCNGSPGYHYTVQIDTSFPEYDIQAVQEAIVLWNKEIGDKTVLQSATVGSCGKQDSSICIHKTTIAYIDQNFGEGHNSLGITHRSFTDDSSDIYIADDYVIKLGLSFQQIRQLMAHEIGHALGLEHTQTGTLMCAYAQCQGLYPTCDDLAQFDNVRGKPEQKGCSFTLSGQ